METVVLPRMATFLITDGKATVAAAEGEARPAGPERFVVLSLNVTSAAPFAVGGNTVLVPRPLFPEGGLWAGCQAEAHGPLVSRDHGSRL